MDSIFMYELAYPGIDGSVYRAPQRLAKAYARGLLRPEG